MKRSGELARRTPLASRTPLKARAKGLRARSAKRARLYVERRALVRRLLERRPMCEVRITGARCPNRSTAVHEIVTRARGGSIVDPANCLCVCSSCHSWIHEHPAEAEQRGWLASASMARED